MSTTAHLRPLIAHAFNAATLHEIAHDLNTAEDTARAREALEQFNTMCDKITDPLAQELRDPLNNAISEGNNRKVMIIADAHDINEHPTVMQIKNTNAEILELQRQLNELHSRRNGFIDKARKQGISDKRIAEIENAVK